VQLNRQTDTQTNAGQNLPTTAVCVGNSNNKTYLSAAEAISSVSIRYVARVNVVAASVPLGIAFDGCLRSPRQ